MGEDVILIVEDEKEIGELVRDYLVLEGFSVLIAEDGEEGLRQFFKENPVLVVLDLMLPKVEGVEVCRQIRAASTVPIVMMSAKQSETDKIIGLGIGADDYITKPFSPGELVARIKAQLRRYKHFSSPSTEEAVLKICELSIDEKEFKVMVRNEEVQMSAREFKLLYFLAKHRGQVFSKEHLFEKVWGYDHIGDFNSLNVYIRKLREKIEVDPSKPKYIKTVWGIGYKFDGEQSR
ncbi:response regulator transcription factor [Bacillus sp. FJAT-45037]|uniref:response regulator transcription factor n=1 Tax=Bacillus sp. FJAT-45037 TaxID=2011007 RepID=UPI000C23F1E3|nr:response regulator transcription factor [Bacillus sp. FJAT-45037]